MKNEDTDIERRDNAQEEAISVATEIFENGWREIKGQIEGVSKKEACKYFFILGFLDYMKIMDKKAETINKELEDMSKEDIEKMISDFRKYEASKDD